MIKGFIFDLDGTITLTEELHYAAYNKVFTAHGVSDYTFEEEITKYAGSGSRNIFTKVFADRGIEKTAEEIEKYREEKQELYTKIVQEAQMKVVPGVREFIARLKNEKKAIATGNNNTDIVRTILRKVGLADDFKEIVSIAEVPRGKPFPDVFLEAARRIGVVPAECIVFEDALNGIKAGRAAEMKVIGIATTISPAQLVEAGADAAVVDFTQLTDKMIYGKI